MQVANIYHHETLILIKAKVPLHRSGRYRHFSTPRIARLQLPPTKQMDREYILYHSVESSFFPLDPEQSPNKN